MILPVLIFGVAAMATLIPDVAQLVPGRSQPTCRGGAGADRGRVRRGRRRRRRAARPAASRRHHRPAARSSIRRDTQTASRLTVLRIRAAADVYVWPAALVHRCRFALGSAPGSGPLGTVVGPLPSLPLLGALPQHVAALGTSGCSCRCSPARCGHRPELCGDAGPGVARLLGTAVATALTAGACCSACSRSLLRRDRRPPAVEVGPDALRSPGAPSSRSGRRAARRRRCRGGPGMSGPPVRSRRRRPGVLPGCSRRRPDLRRRHQPAGPARALHRSAFPVRVVADGRRPRRRPASCTPTSSATPSFLVPYPAIPPGRPGATPSHRGGEVTARRRGASPG